jgi:hypothetical protein
MKMWAIAVPAVVLALNVIPDIEKRIIVDNTITSFLRYYCSIYSVYKEVMRDYYVYKPLSR